MGIPLELKIDTLRVRSSGVILRLCFWSMSLSAFVLQWGAANSYIACAVCDGQARVQADSCFDLGIANCVVAV